MVADVALSAISMYQNYRDVEPPSEKDDDVIELAKSIAKLGVMQPVLLREDPKKKEHYQLIFGHRRFLAAKVAGLTAIPATVKPVPDDDILELQVTENLQRKDVHPMDEAVAFKKLHEVKKLPIEEIASRFAKRPEYVAQRLNLNDLIEDLQKLFKKNGFLLGHALLLARLTPADQKEAWSRNRNQVSVADLKDFIDRNIVQTLRAAPWKTADAELVPSAGPCSTCTKRSGCNTLLFADIKEDDRCFDKSCYTSKLAAFLTKHIEEIIETQPDVLFVVENGDKIPVQVNNLLQSHKIKVLQEYSQFYESKSYNFKKPAKGIYVAGMNAGKIKTIYLPGEDKASKKATASKKPEELNANEKKELISDIQKRERRNKEIDINKVHRMILEKVDKNDRLKKPGFKNQGKVDRSILVYLLLHEVQGSYALQKLKGKIKLPAEPRGLSHGYALDYFKALGNVSDDDIAFIVRTIAIEKYGNPKLSKDVHQQDTALYLMAEYAGIDIKSIQLEQSEKAALRNIRVEKRIDDLKSPAKESTAKKTATNETKVPVKKSATKKPAKKNANR